MTLFSRYFMNKKLHYLVTLFTRSNSLQQLFPISVADGTLQLYDCIRRFACEIIKILGLSSKTRKVRSFKFETEYEG